MVPGSFTTGTNHYAHAGHPSDEYAALYGTTIDDLLARQAEQSPADADPAEVAREITRVVGLPKGTRPFRVFIDPAQDGAEEVFRVGDRIRRDFYRGLGFPALLGPAT